MKWVEKRKPINSTSTMSGERNPYAGQSALRTVKKKSIPTTVTVGITRGQYTSHDSVTLGSVATVRGFGARK